MKEGGIGHDANGNVTSITTTRTEKQTIDGKKVDVTVETTYHFTYTITEGTTTTTGGTKYEDTEEEKKLTEKWVDDAECSATGYRGAWVFDYTGGIFVVKQSSGAVIWDPNGELGGTAYGEATDDQKQLLAKLLNDGSMKNMTLKFADTNITSFQVGKYYGKEENNGAAWVEVKDGKVYVYGKKGEQDGLSHFNMGTTTTTPGTTTLDGQYSWNAQGKHDVGYTGKGTGDAMHAVDPDGITVTLPSISGSLSGTKYEGNLSYSYTVPSVGYDVSFKGETTAARNINVKADVSTVEDRNDPGDPDDPTVTVPDEDVPLVETPDVEIGEPEVPLAETPDVEIEDSEVPLAEAPEEVEILDDEVPLADVPKTGENIMAEMMALAAAAASALFLTVIRKRRSN